MRNTEFEEFLEKYKLTPYAFARLVHVDADSVRKYIHPKYIRNKECGKELKDKTIWKIEAGRNIIEINNMIYPVYEIQHSPMWNEELYVADCQKHYKEVEMYKAKFEYVFSRCMKKYEIISNMKKKIVAANLSRLRKSHGITQQRLSELTGIKLNTIRVFESKGTLNKEYIEQLAYFYGVKVEELHTAPCGVDETVVA